jgi:RHS repeat-associated protein
LPKINWQTWLLFFNVRGQLRGVNLDANENPQVSQDKLFSYKIDYHEDGRYFDGSISKQTWLAKTPPSVAGGLRSYLYTYDIANRLTNAQYSGVGNENYSVSQSYDVNGNIQNLQRNSKTGANTWGLVDNLTYGYLNTGNKLQKVDDAVTGNAIASDFRDVSGNDYAYSVDGKLTKDGNKNITNIRYNYLDLVSTIKFANGDSVSYSYSSTGSRIQRKVTKAGQPDSYTIYDGSMVYTYAGASPTLASFGISEIQNSEGRYVNGKLEYGYTDHVGNLRLSYKDSLGVAFVTQSQSYDPWSNVNFGSEYYLSVNQGDRYLVSGKETDNLTGNILLDWRDYDSVTGRMNSFDPANQSMSMSGYAYCGNNPVMRIDPDGRFAFVPFLVGALVSGHIGGVISGIGGGSYGKGFVTGFLSGAAGYFAPIGFLPGMAYGAGTGGVIGGINAAMNGGNIWKGALTGAIAGGAIGGISGGIGALQKGGDFWTGYREPQMFGVNEADAILKGSQEGPAVSRSDYRKFVNKQFPNESKIMKSVDRVRLPKGAAKNPNGSFKTPTGDALGITHPSTWQGGRSARVFISDAAFQSEARLFLTVGHEYTHAQHILDGLDVAFTNNDINRISPEDFNTYDWSGMTEHSAYQWTVDAAYKNGWNSLGKSYADVMFEKEYGYDLKTTLFNSRVNTIFRR